jgi:hypothetical protein
VGYISAWANTAYDFDIRQCQDDVFIESELCETVSLQKFEFHGKKKVAFEVIVFRSQASNFLMEIVLNWSVDKLLQLQIALPLILSISERGKQPIMTVW